MRSFVTPARALQVAKRSRRQQVPGMRGRSPRRLPGNRQPAAFSNVLEKDQGNHFPRIHRHRSAALHAVTPCCRAVDHRQCLDVMPITNSCDTDPQPTLSAHARMPSESELESCPESKATPLQRARRCRCPIAPQPVGFTAIAIMRSQHVSTAPGLSDTSLGASRAIQSSITPTRLLPIPAN